MQPLISKRLGAVQFSFLTPQQIRTMSVKQITQLKAYKDKKAQHGGVQDSALGASIDDEEKCATCEQTAFDCPGHLGHIELILPVYNPTLIDRLLKLMRASCLNCHQLRIRRKTISDFSRIFKLIRMGKLKEALQLKRLQQTIIDKPKKQKSKDKEQRQRIIESRERTAKELKRQKHELIELANQSPADPEPTYYQNSLFSELSQELFQRVMNKCPNCNRPYKAIRRQGCSKFLIQTRKLGNQQSSRSEPHQSNTNFTSKIKSSCQQRKLMLLQPSQVQQHVKALFLNEFKVLNFIYGRGGISNGPDMFFIQVVVVPPVRFRPVSSLNDSKYLHDHTILLLKILESNIALKKLLLTTDKKQLTSAQKKTILSQNEHKSILGLKDQPWFLTKLTDRDILNNKQILQKWLQVQNFVNVLIDSSKAHSTTMSQMNGVRQIIQKKEGLFRNKIMGKRVNYSARSVISPDPSLTTNEVGIPLFMAKKLTFPQPVNQYNVQILRKMIINGTDVYPGANLLQQNGKIINLDVIGQQQRIAFAKNLLAGKQKKIVYRHVVSGDQVFFNRQPSLHRPSMMSHIVKVLPKQQTLRMHYANCKSYNADFDGDQMNLHVVQNYAVKAECSLNLTDAVYQNITSGQPIRQLIQDQIVSAVYLTMKNRFLPKHQYQQLLYQSTQHLLQGMPYNKRIWMLPPALVKPKPMWTGKQLISNVIKLVVQLSGVQKPKGISLNSNTRINAKLFHGFSDQSQVKILNNQLISGVIDKNQLGSGCTFGLMHHFFQIYGAKPTGKLFTSLTKLFTNFLQRRGFSCGLQDLQVEQGHQIIRINEIQQLHHTIYKNVAKDLKVDTTLPKSIRLYNRIQSDSVPKDGIDYLENDLLQAQIASRMIRDSQFSKELDQLYGMHKSKQEQLVASVFNGLASKFPRNMFSVMVNSGAKGSIFNHIQCSVMLGQQDLQGRRVPISASGTTLTCFQPFSANPRHHGYIADRFLSGLRPQDFYFHCMSGRDGLIDTAVKTSRSGYLQRCLIKNLQGLIVHYDLTVRDCDNSIVQFYYGDDGVNPNKGIWHDYWNFFENNHVLIKEKYNWLTQKLSSVSRSVSAKETNMNVNRPNKQLGCISQRSKLRLNEFLGKSKLSSTNKASIQKSFFLNYVASLMNPGQAVGCTASQAIGQPSTQMTLNTFHQAGHGGANLTLGVPRLRQILMTSCDTIKTPIMQVYFSKGCSQKSIQSQLIKLKKTKLSQLVKEVTIVEYKSLPAKLQSRARVFQIQLVLHPLQKIQQSLSLSSKKIQRCIRQIFLKRFLHDIDRSLKKKGQGLVRAQVHKKNKKDDDQNQDQFQAEDIQKDKKGKAVGQQYMRGKLKFSEKGRVQFIVGVPLEQSKFLMTNILKRQLQMTLLRQVKGLSQARLIAQKQKQPYIQTQGVNFLSVLQLTGAEFYRTKSNDIRAILKTFGVQAARSSIINQIKMVFGSYGVKCNYRHLSLIADYMTFPGCIRAMNRMSIQHHTSPFMKISFQTALKFITDAAVGCEMEFNRSASSSITLGRAPFVGTGCFDLLTIS